MLKIHFLLVFANFYFFNFYLFFNVSYYLVFWLVIHRLFSNVGISIAYYIINNSRQFRDGWCDFTGCEGGHRESSFSGTLFTKNVLFTLYSFHLCVASCLHHLLMIPPIHCSHSFHTLFPSACGKNFYKPLLGNESCVPCPHGSTTDDSATASQCMCTDPSTRMINNICMGKCSSPF